MSCQAAIPALYCMHCVCVSYCTVVGTITPLPTVYNSPPIVYNSYYVDVPNETYWYSYDTLFNFEYEDLRENNGEDNITGFYILLGLFCSIILFILAADIFNWVCIHECVSVPVCVCVCVCTDK